MPVSDLKPEGFSNCDLCYDIVIIGGGVAGLSAALYAAQDGFKTLLLEGEAVSNTDLPGGALMLTEKIANYPGFPAAEGMELIQTIKDQVLALESAEIEEVRASAVELSTDPHEVHKVHTPLGIYKSRVVIITTGALARQLNIPGEEKWYGQGVHTCATCDAMFYNGKNVAVIGGGDTAVEDALVLARHASQVTMIHRRENLRAVGTTVMELEDHEQISLITSAFIQEVVDNEQNVTGIIYERAGERITLDLDGVFVAIGRDPATSILDREPVELDSEGYIVVESDTTKVKGGAVGVFAAGDAVDKVYRQAIVSAGKGAQAALDARAYLIGA
jgi:thioredoxin reductase (NADPH)